MIDLTKKILPDTVEINGNEYKLRTDWRDKLSFNKAVRNKTIGSTISYYFLDSEVKCGLRDAITALAEFYNPKDEIPRGKGNSDGTIMFDWDIDADYLYGAFYEVYGIDLFDKDMHFYLFDALFKSLHGTKLNDIMGYRSYKDDEPGEKFDYKKAQRELREMWEIKPEQTEEEKRNMEEFEETFE